MFTAKEIGELIEMDLTDPKYNKILVVDADKVKNKREERKKMKENLAQRDRDEMTVGPRRKKQKIESKEVI